jgi:DNA-binding transcriptional ArsR family regulator
VPEKLRVEVATVRLYTDGRGLRKDRRMKDPLQPERCARKLAALAAPERLRIVRCLRDGPRSVSDIAELLAEPLVNISHHLTVLRHAGLVKSERKGRFMIYSLAPSVFRPEQAEAGAQQLDLGCCRIDLSKPAK